MNLKELYDKLGRKIRLIVVSNDRDERIWELLVESNQEYIELKAFLDVKSSSWGMYKYRGKETGIKVVSVGRALQLQRQGAVDIFLIYSCHTEYDEYSFQSFKQLGIEEDIIWFLPYEYVYRGKQIEVQSMHEITPFMGKHELETVEIHAAEHCNLNCKFCSMFCGLVKKPAFPDYEKTKKGLEELKKYITHVKRVRLLGGEPLLNPELERYIELVRSIYPYTDIRLLSNGILVKNMSDSLIESIKQNNVTFVVTGYQPLMDKHEEIHEFLEEKGVRHKIGNLITEFQKIYDYRGTGDAASNYNVCSWKKNCTTLYEGRLSPCFPPMVIHYLSEAFDLDIPESGIINLYEEGMTSEKIQKFFDAPFDLCRYCAEKRLFAKWERMQQGENIKIEDWSA